jgi:hypothetical protein
MLTGALPQPSELDHSATVPPEKLVHSSHAALAVSAGMCVAKIAARATHTVLAAVPEPPAQEAEIGQSGLDGSELATINRITLFALPVNLFILPLLAVLMPTALLTLVTLIAWPAAAIVPAVLTGAFLHLGVGLVHFFGSAAMGDFRIPLPSCGNRSPSARFWP